MISNAVNLRKLIISNDLSLKILKSFLNLFVTQIFYHKNGKQGFEGDLKVNYLRVYDPVEMRGRITHRVSNHRNIPIFDELYFLQVAFPCNIDFLIFHDFEN